MGSGRGRSRLIHSNIGIAVFRSFMIFVLCSFLVLPNLSIAATLVDNGVLQLEINDRGDITSVVVNRLGESLFLPAWSLDKSAWKKAIRQSGISFGLPFAKGVLQKESSKGELRVHEVVDRPLTLEFVANQENAPTTGTGLN